MSLGQVFIEREGFARGLFCFAPAFDGGKVAAQSKNCIGISQARVGERIIVVFFNRLLVIADGLKEIFAGATLGIHSPLHVILESFEVFGGTLRKLLSLRATQL